MRIQRLWSSIPVVEYDRLGKQHAINIEPPPELSMRA